MQINGDTSESLLESQILCVFSFGSGTPQDWFDIHGFGIDGGEGGSEPAFRNFPCDLLELCETVR